MNTCKNCKHYKQGIGTAKKEISTGIEYVAMCVNGEYQFDPEKYTLVKVPYPSGSCSNADTNEQIMAYEFDVSEDFGCIHFEQKKI